MVYFLIFILLASLAALDLIKETIKIKVFCFCCVVVLLITLSAVRWEVGPDWESYLSFYRDIDLYTKGFLMSSNFMEPGYTFLNQLLSDLGFSYTGFLATIAIITIGLKSRVIFAHKEIMMTVLLLYYCYYLADIASVRQFTAVSITLVSSIYIIRRKPLIFASLVLAATLIHATSVFFLLAYWLFHLEHSRKLLYSVLVGSLVLGIINITDIAINAFVSVIGGQADLAYKLLKYQEQGLESANNPYIGFIAGALKRVLVLPLFIWGARIVDDVHKQRYSGYLNLLVFGNALYFLFAFSIPVMQRLTVPFLIFEIFLWAYLMISFKDIKLRFAFFFIILAFGALRLYSFMAPYKELYFPFKTIF